jgi:pimeloyl-ACP methyl ester carboxylesterase
MKLAFRKFGEGKALLILHGLFGQSDNWNTLAKQFSEQNFEVFTIDLRNHGLSPQHEDWNYEVMANDIKEFIIDYNIKNPILLGHSMGGKVAMTFALNYDGIIEKLIVADIAPVQYPAHHHEVLHALNSVDFNQVTTRKDIEEILSKSISDFGTRQFLLKNIYWENSAENKMNWRFNLKVITEKYHEILSEVNHKSSLVNTLFIRGEKSNYILDEHIDGITERFPNSKLVTIPNAGHWVHAEQPKLFFDEVMRFIYLH